MIINQKLKYFTAFFMALIASFLYFCPQVLAIDKEADFNIYNDYCNQKPTLTQVNRRINIRNDIPITPNVYPSCEEETNAYYKLISSSEELDYPAGKEVRLDSNNKEEKVDSLDELLSYFGYEGLKSVFLENIPSNILMPNNAEEFTQLVNTVKSIDEKNIDFENRFGLSDFNNDKVLATGFFAPKITDASVQANPPGQQRKYGWRKLVRLRARVGSKAAEKKLESLHLLFNLFTTVNLDPFNPSNVSGRSQNTQAMLIRGEGSNLKNSVYWLDYGPISSGGRPVKFLGATFDYRDPTLNGGGINQNQKYFVPGACAECHGVKKPDSRKNLIFPDGKLNYLDTDHWFDRTDPDNDFPEIADSPYGVLFDGGKDQSSLQFSKAFDVIRKINSEIVLQNKLSGDSNSFQVRAAGNWLKLHTDGINNHFPPIDRALPPEKSGDAVWTKGNPIDEALLPKLNQFCFRCHSSLIYHVFDKQAVKKRADFIKYVMSPGKLDGKDIVPDMPQDRVLDENIRQKIISLVQALKESK